MIEQIRAVMEPLLDKYSFGVDVLGMDISHGHIHQIPSGQMMQGFIMTIVCRGALIGPGSSIQVQALIAGSLPPTEDEAIKYYMDVFETVRKAKAQQLSITNGQNPVGGPNDGS